MIIELTHSYYAYYNDTAVITFKIKNDEEEYDTTGNYTTVSCNNKEFTATYDNGLYTVKYTDADTPLTATMTASYGDNTTESIVSFCKVVPDNDVVYYNADKATKLSVNFEVICEKDDGLSFIDKYNGSGIEFYDGDDKINITNSSITFHGESDSDFNDVKGRYYTASITSELNTVPDKIRIRAENNETNNEFPDYVEFDVDVRTDGFYDAEVPFWNNSIQLGNPKGANNLNTEFRGMFVEKNDSITKYSTYVMDVPGNDGCDCSCCAIKYSSDSDFIPTASVKVHNHICDHYIVDAVYDDNNDGWMFRLFEGHEHPRNVMTFTYLSTLSSGTVTGLPDLRENETYSENYDKNLFMKYDGSCWVIRKVSDKVIAGYVSEYFPSNNNPQAVYKVYYGNGFQDNFDNDKATFKKSMHKGILLSTVQKEDTALNFHEKITFKKDNDTILEFAFDTTDNNQENHIKYICMHLEEKNTYNDIVNNDEIINFTKDSGNSTYDMLFSFKDGLQEKLDVNYINGTYRVISVGIDKDGNHYRPINKDLRMVYFDGKIKLGFINNITYINSITGRLAKIPFNLTYSPPNSSEPIDVEGVPIDFTTIEGAYHDIEITNGIQNSTSQTFDYPYKWTDGNYSNNGVTGQDTRVEYDDEDECYYLYAPFGMSEIPTTKYVYVDNSVYGSNSTQLGGYYKIADESKTGYACVYERTKGTQMYIRAVYIKPYTGNFAEEDNSEFKPTLVQSKNEYDSNVYATWAFVNTDRDITENSILLIANNFSTETVNVEDAFANGYATWNSVSVEKNNNSYELQCTNPTTSSGVILLKDGTDQHGQSHMIYYRLNDDFGNSTDIPSTIIQIHTIKPSMLSLTLTGSSGSTNYTGYYEKHGRFFPSEYITAGFSAHSDIRMSYTLTGNTLKSGVSGKSLISGVGYRHLLKANPRSLGAGILESASDSVIAATLTVTDEAGNESTAQASIKYISRLLRTKHQHLRETDTSYSHKIYSGENAIDEKTIGKEFTRSWNEIWYPETHGAPLNTDGSINYDEALRMASEGMTAAEKLKYDALALEKNALSTDVDGRYIQNTDKWSKTKRYPAKENARLVNDTYQTYWIIDNTGNQDFQLEFEIFDFSSQITKYPENLCARYTGDMLSVFDASDPDCVYDDPVIDDAGRKKWVLKDSTKLSHLFTLKGSYDKSKNNPFTMLDSEVSGNLTETGNGFTCPNITQCSRICIVPFSDYGEDDSSRGTGFKLKAGQKHYAEYTNYECAEGTGEFWIHKSPSGNLQWSSVDNAVISYDYYESDIDTDFEEGHVKFGSRLAYPMLSTFVHYLYLNSPSSIDTSYYVDKIDRRPYPYFSIYRDDYSTDANNANCLKSFITSEDDFVDYANCSFYVSFTGSSPVKNTLYDSTSLNDCSEGKLTSYQLDKDTGIITFTTPPRGRLFADYYHHTFYRLTSDGYGDLYFYGTGILVPASATDSYTDWAYVDLKIVNEGGTALVGGQLQFLSRGYITKGTIVDTVLDLNRPWDVQEGTTAETVNRTGAKCEPTYDTLKSTHAATRANAYTARSSQTCSLGTVDSKKCVYVRVFWTIAANKEGTAWIDCTKGAKTFSGEISGSYNILTT